MFSSDSSPRLIVSVRICIQFRQRIFAVSAHLSPEIPEAYQWMGVQVVMEEPFNVEELRSAVSELAAYRS